MLYEQQKCWGGPGKGCLQKWEKSMRQKRKEMGVKETVRKGSKYKHELWKGMLQGIVYRSDTERPNKDEGRENQIICP
jgi:hypothetical protein